MQVRFRRPCLPHFGQGAFLGAQWTGRTTGVGASVPMVCISGGEDSQDLHSPGCRSYLSRAKRLGIPARLVEISAECQKRCRSVKLLEAFLASQLISSSRNNLQRVRICMSVGTQRKYLSSDINLSHLAGIASICKEE